jgi:hypothetical protein
MSDSVSVSLAINVAPPDLPTATHTLPHQLRQWGKQVDEIVLVLDLHQSVGKYAEGWKERLPGIRRLLDDCCSEYPHARAVEVDYDPAVVSRIRQVFIDGPDLPAKDLLGGPFYPYFFALDAVTNDYVLHTDADMMFGGGSQTWIAEASELLRNRPDVLICSPLPGPPAADGKLRSQMLEREPANSLAFRAHWVSSRIMFTDMRRFYGRVGPVAVTRPSFRGWLRAVVDGNPPADNFETIYSAAMSERGLMRIDFLGESPGMWSVHPPFRSQLFYERLPWLIKAIESDDIPEAARGHHQVHDSMVDWASARRLTDPAWRRAVRHQRLLMRNVTRRLRSGRSEYARP